MGLDLIQIIQQRKYKDELHDWYSPGTQHRILFSCHMTTVVLFICHLQQENFG